MKRSFKRRGEDESVFGRNPVRKSLYKLRKNRKDFVSQMAPEEEVDDLDREDVLRLNRIKRRFSKKQIEEFIEEHIEKDVLDIEKLSLTSEEDFEKLILAYDLSTRKNSKYKTLEEDAETELKRTDTVILH